MSSIVQTPNYETIGLFYKKRDFLESYIEDYESKINNKYYKVYDYLIENGYDAGFGNTIIYSYMIVSVMEKINEENIEEELKNPFSQFYLSLADDELDMGIKTFHSNMLNRVYTGSEADRLAIETYAMEALRIAKELKKDNKILIKK